MGYSERLDALEGATLAGKYRLVSLLGVGGMGYVYQAEQLELGRSVAIKILRAERIASGFSWFRSEAMAASRLNHPHAVAIYDVGKTEDGVPYLVMEHLRGQTLSSLLRDRPLPLQRIITIGSQVLSALAEAHACGVVHCDLTSDNVIVEHLCDGGDFAKVIDFGLARLLGRSRGVQGAFGTPECMAPEQIRGEAIGPAADLYAVGVLLYEMIVGRTPFAGAPIAAMVEAHLSATPTAPRDVVADCPQDLSDLVLWALGKSPEHRPATAGIMRDMLVSVVDSQLASRCPACAQRSTLGQRFCANCGAMLADGRPTPTRETSRFGSGRSGSARSSSPARRSAARISSGVTPKRHWRSTRLTCEQSGPARPLIGRRAELERLLHFCHGGSGNRVLAVCGPPGIGKARLVLEAASRLGPTNLVFFAAADPSGCALPWYPILSMLENVLGIEGEVTEESLSRAVARCGLPAGDLPGLAEIFSLAGPAESLELAVRRREAHAAALRALLSTQRRFPGAILCFADLHEYDAPSRQVVDALSHAADGDLRLLATITSQTDAPAGAVLLPLAGLAAPEALELARSLAGPETPLPAAPALHALTGGSPAAVEQLAGWVLMGNNPASAPSLLVDLVSVRVNRMPAAARRVLQATAIHGSVVPRWLVEATLGDGQAIEIAEPAWTGLLVIENDELTIPSELVASVIHACTPADVKRRLHQRALQALEGSGSPAVLAHHAEEAGELDRAYDEYLAAGKDAVRRFDDPGAATWLGRAVAVAREQRNQGAPGAEDKWIAAATMLADVLGCMGEHGLARGVLSEAEVLTASSRYRAEVQRVRGRLATASGQVDEAIGHFRAAIGEGLRAGERDFLCQAYIDLSRALDAAGQPAAAAQELCEALDVITAGAGIPIKAAPHRLWELAMHLAERYLRLPGCAEKARQAGEAALEQAVVMGSARGRGRVSSLLARIYETIGEPAAALRHRANAIDEMRRLGDRRSTAELLIDNATLRPKGRVITAAAPPEVHWSEAAASEMRLAQRLALEVGWADGAHGAAPPNSAPGGQRGAGAGGRVPTLRPNPRRDHGGMQGDKAEKNADLAGNAHRPERVIVHAKEAALHQQTAPKGNGRRH